MKPYNILVVGMPRSGTSMTAGALARAGYHVSDAPENDLREGDAGNPGGYWESEALVRRNTEVLSAAGFDHDNTWLFDPITDEQAENIARLEPLPGHADYVAQMATHEPWIWKDPRLCYTLAYWQKLLAPSTTRIVLTTRDPSAIYRSFIRLGWRDPSDEAQEDVLRRVDHHISFARAAIAEATLESFEFSYEGCLADPTEAARILSLASGLTITNSHLAVDKDFNHSTLRGRISTSVDRFAERLPAPVRRGLKAVVPRSVVYSLFPERRPR